MAIKQEQVVSYGLSAGTGGAGWLTRMVSDVSQWSAMEQLTALCMLLGALGVMVRIYVDWSAHCDRKRREREEATQCPDRSGGDS